MLCNIPETASSPLIFVRGRISIGFRLDSTTSTIVIEYEYYPATHAIDYVDVRFTDRKLQSKVEGDPQMMMNIDNYLRKVLNEESATLRKGIHPFY
jgi:hypothetical protein